MLAGWTRTEQYNIMREIMTDAICKGHFHVPAQWMLHIQPDNVMVILHAASNSTKCAYCVSFAYYRDCRYSIITIININIVVALFSPSFTSASAAVDVGMTNNNEVFYYANAINLWAPLCIFRILCSAGKLNLEYQRHRN